jgi:protein gp37
MDARLHVAGWGPNGRRVLTTAGNWEKVRTWNRRAAAKRQPETVFVASLADVFEDWNGPISDQSGKELRWSDVGTRFANAAPLHAADDELTMQDIRRELFRLMDDCPWLLFLVLTKRPLNIAAMWVGDRLKNALLGVSVENQEAAEQRIFPLLVNAGRVQGTFLSCEPLLGPVDLTRVVANFDNQEFGTYDVLTGFKRGIRSSLLPKPIDWVIAGGESGKGARGADSNWFRSLRDQCKEACVPFFFKQWGSATTYDKVAFEKFGDVYFPILDGQIHCETGAHLHPYHPLHNLKGYRVWK